MSAVASENIFDHLGNIQDEDSDQEAERPINIVEKHVMRTSKRNAPTEPPNKTLTGVKGKAGNRGVSGNEEAYRDRNAGSAKNRGKPIEFDERRKGYGINSGHGRGNRGGPRNFDRHSRGVVRDSERQVNHGWGANEGGAELSDEQAGEALANAEKEDKSAWDTTETKTEPTQEAEIEETSISYAEYMLQQQEKRAALAAKSPDIRQPNEGSNKDNQWAHAKPISREDNEPFFQGAGGKVKRERERRQKQIIEIDQRFVETSDRGGRSNTYRGNRGNRGGRGGRGGRNDGNQRAGRGGFIRENTVSSASIDTNDANAFPTLGS